MPHKKYDDAQEEHPGDSQTQRTGQRPPGPTAQARSGVAQPLQISSSGGSSGSGGSGSSSSSSSSTGVAARVVSHPFGLRAVHALTPPCSTHLLPHLCAQVAGPGCHGVDLPSLCRRPAPPAPAVPGRRAAGWDGGGYRVAAAPSTVGCRTAVTHALRCTTQSSARCSCAVQLAGMQAVHVGYTAAQSLFPR